MATGSLAAAEPTAPQLDVVRIGSDGTPLLAGRAEPFAKLIVLDNGQMIGAVQADGRGEWVFYGEQPVSKGAHDFAVAVQAPTAAIKMTRPDVAADTDAADADAADTNAADTDATAAAPADPPEPAVPEAAPAAEEVQQPVTTAPETDPPAPLPAGQKPVPGPVGDATDDTAVPPLLPATKPRVEDTAVPDDYYVVQLGSLPTAGDARRLWREVSTRNPQLTSDREALIQEGTLTGGGAVYRLRTGSFASRSEARALCRAFRRAGEDCLVVLRRQRAG